MLLPVHIQSDISGRFIAVLLILLLQEGTFPICPWSCSSSDDDRWV